MQNYQKQQKGLREEIIILFFIIKENGINQKFQKFICKSQ